jgi:tetratricopeptide (TPR) repeat protein
MALKTLRIFISSPGDVAEERLIARRAIGRLDSQVGDLLHLEAVFWEHHPLLATSSFQEQLPNPSETDIVISILWSRLGTVLPKHIRRPDGTTYASGTEFEFEDAMEGHRRAGKPQLLVYRKTAKPDWSGDATVAASQLEQQQSLERFLTKWFANGDDGSLKAAFHPFATPADFEELLEAHLVRLVEQYLPAGVSIRASAPIWRNGSPFRGLQPFETEHAPVFFGRTAAVASILLKLRRQADRGKAFVLTVSASGAGKSSLLRAGVLPLLLQPGVVGRAGQWRHAIMRPSEGQGDLLLALTRALQSATALPSLQEGDRSTLVERVRTALEHCEATQPGSAGSDCHLALLLDQLEEMFSDERVTAREREQFVTTVAALSRSGCVFVLATLRSDVYPRLGELPQLIDLKEGDGQFDLLPPALREIGQIIRSPAAAAGLRFEARAQTSERLDETIRDAAASNPGALPLLEFLLEELYKLRNSEHVLTFKAYEELGGVEGALARRAEQVFARVSPAAQSAASEVFGELVALGVDDATKVLRRSPTRRAFAANPAALELVDALVEARLLISGSDARGEPVISLAHEALLQFWPRFADWRERNRENLHIRARLSAAVAVWESHQRSPDFLLARGKPIAEARALIADGVRLTAGELGLVGASVQRARRFARLRASAIVSLAVLSVLATVAAYLANHQSNVARTQAATAQRTTDFMVNMFATADPEENRGATITVREILDRGVTEMSSSLSEEPAVRSNLLRAMGQAYNGLGLYPKAHRLLQEAASGAGKSGDKANILEADLALAANRYADAAYTEAESLYRQSLALARTLHGQTSPTVSEALSGLAQSLYAQDKTPESERLYRQALDIDLELHGENHADTARSLDALGFFLYSENRYEEAEPLWRRALAVRLAVLGGRHAKTAESLNNLGSLFYQEGKFGLADRSWSQALDVERVVFGESHANTASTLNNLGRVELLRGKLADAKTHLSEALTIVRNNHTPGHDDTLVELNSLAMVAIEQSDFAAAETHLHEALDIARARHHWMLDQLLTNYGDLYVRTDRLPEATGALTEARQTLQARYGKALQGAEGWRVAILESIEGSCATARRDFGSAEKALLGALPALTQRFGNSGLYARQTNARLERLYIMWGRDADAAVYRTRLAQIGTAE